MGTAKNYEADGIDRRILDILSRDGRLSFRDLCEQVHLSPKMQGRSGFVGCSRGISSADFTRRSITQNWALALQAYIDVRLRPGTSAQSFEAVAMKLPGVINAAILTGSLDFRLRVACKDQSDLVQLIETLRSRAGVQETNTALILTELPGNTRLSGR